MSQRGDDYNIEVVRNMEMTINTPTRLSFIAPKRTDPFVHDWNCSPIRNCLTLFGLGFLRTLMQYKCPYSIELYFEGEHI